MIKLVITDLDDTLYSWIGFFIPAFYDMMQELSLILDVPQNELIKEYKTIHQEVGSVEYPFATLKLPSVRKAYQGISDEQISIELNSAFHKFNATRKKLLKLYPEVDDTLRFFRHNNIIIVAYTESAEENGFYRLKKLGIDNFFKDVYVSDSLYKRPDTVFSSPKTHIVHGKKPNVDILKDICSGEKIDMREAVYIGDSLSKDMLMAKQAGVVSIWCDYPKDDIAELYSKLVAISHWNEQDFKQEEKYKNEWKVNNYSPDYTIHSFGECKGIIAKINGLTEEE
ncbi:MAG: HAD family hydrolase [Lachnospiraceae bacterium]|nr:HAD family hydrolase [Lachnospiraceae bacterium]